MRLCSNFENTLEFSEPPWQWMSKPHQCLHWTCLININDCVLNLITYIFVILASATPQEILDFICEHSLENDMPNVFIALWVLLILSTNVINAERCFSEPKFISSYIYSWRAKKGFIGLPRVTVSIEIELAQKVLTNRNDCKFWNIKNTKICISNLWSILNIFLSKFPVSYTHL